MKKILTFLLTALLAFGVGWAETTTLTNANIVAAGSGSTSYKNWTMTDGNGNSWYAYAIKNQHSNATSGYHYLQIKKYASNTAYYIQVPELGSKITQIQMTVSGSSQPMTGGSNSATLYFSSSNSTSAAGTGVASGTGASSVMIDCSSLNLNTGYITAGGAVRIWDVTVTYETGGSTPAEENWYRKVTSTSDLVSGKKYIFMYENGNSSVGMGAISNNYGTGITGLAIDNNRVNIGGSAVEEFTLGGSSDAWTFINSQNRYLGIQSTGSDGLGTSGSANYADLKWTITSSGTIKNNQESKYIRTNSSATRFGLFTSGSYAYLYVKDDGSTPVQTCADPVFNPNGGVFTGSAQVTITSATEGATIYYTTDGNDPVVSKSSIANGGTVNLTESCTLKAMAVKSGMNNSAIVTSQSYTINSGGGSNSKIYRKVTSTDDLTAGQKYIIMYENNTSSVGMGAYDGTKHFNGVQNLTVSNNRVDISNTSVLEMTLGGSTGAWTLYAGDGYIQGADAVQFSIVANATANNSKWIITNTVSGTNGFVVENAQYARYIKFFDSTSGPTFRHYNSGNGVWAYLYVQDNSTDPVVTISPDAQTISDAAPAELTITGTNVSGSINASLATNTDWYLNPNTFSNEGGTATLTYNGRALSATNTVTASASGATDATATVNYVADLYIVTDNGVTNDWHFDGQYGVHMTNNNGIYTADFAVTTPNTYILFARKLGDGVTWNTRYVFGPNSGGDWWLPVSGNGDGTLDLNDDDPIKIQTTGLFTITINANDGTFTITKRNIDVTISPADGTHFTGPSISGTIASDPAGTIEWSTNGTDWQPYTDGFTATVATVGQSVTVYARSTVNGVVSDVASATYTRDYAPAPDAPSFSMGSGAVATGTVITITAPEGCTLYVDGQQVTSPYDVTITQGTTISAYCVNDEGTQSTTVTNTYTIAAVCTATVQFDDNDSDSSTEVTTNSIQGYYTAGANYISSVSAISKVYKGKTGLKFGSSGNSGTITFNLASGTDWKVNHITLNAKNYSGNTVSFTVTTSDGQSKTTGSMGSSLGGYTLDFGGTAITSITIRSTERAYLKGFTITYDCAPEVEAPVINPATGTYYENQTVEITCDSETTIHYTTDGSEPTANSPVYNGTFTVNYTAGGTTTIKAIAYDNQNNPSPVVEAIYTWGVPTVTIIPDSRLTTAESVTVTLTGSPAGAQVYYTTDGSTPSAQNGTLYDGPFSVALEEIGSQVTVNAIAVYGSLTSDVASATYTRVEKMVDVATPFFSPLVNHTYYGDQTLQIGCTTPNADIYYEIVEVSGTTAPSANEVEDPSKSSTYYDGTAIPMTVGNSYYVKAIAYIGNYASTVAEGWYTIVAAPQTEYTYATLKDFNDNCPTGVTAHLLNPVQVVYHSTYTNNGEFAEFCFLRDNTDYACVYFGKRDTSGKTIFKMGDWIDGSQISGLTNIWERNFHIQLGTNAHTVYNWPSSTIGWSEIIPEEMTNDVIVAGTSDGDNVWGHYVHLRNTRLHDVTDLSESDPKHTGLINDGTADAYYYDKFYRWSAGTCEYTTGGHTYTDPIQCLGDYDQAFFTAKQNAGATFDVYGVVDYYSLYEPPFEICPIDFLWAYKPVMAPATTTSYEPVTVDITATHPEWAAEGVVIYYKTDDMEEWVVYTDPITVNSTTTIQAYAEVPAEKLDGTNYNDMVRSEVVTETYTIEGIVDPTISPASQVIPVVTGTESLTVTITDHNEVGSSAVTTYTVNGVEYTLEAGQSVDVTVDETTTITAVSSIVSGENTLYSNEVTETYTFARSNGIEYHLLKAAPVVGNIYVIVNKAANMGMSNTQNATNRGSTGVLFKDNTKEIVYGNDDIAQFVLEQVSGNRYYFKSLTGDGGYLYVESNDYANLVTTSSHDASGYDVATVTVGENNNDVDKSYPATITFTYEGTVHTMRYFANGRTFSTYTDASLNEDVFLYGAQVTPLHVIERDFTPSTQEQVTVSDRLVGVWAAKNILWAKDQNYASIDATSKRDDQLDYVRMAKLKSTEKAFQYDEWEQSNWVMLDFSNTNDSPEDYVGYEFDNNSVIGYYVDDLNYRIELVQAPTKVNHMDGYIGFTADPVDLNDNYRLNHYVSSNFYEPNLNWGEYTGYWFEEEYNGHSIDTCLFFMNPKIQEIAQVWAVWNSGLQEFTIYEREGYSVNAYNLDGAFTLSPEQWQYNRRQTTSGLSEEENYGSVQDQLQDNGSYLFHIAIMRSDYNYGHRKSNSQPTGKRDASALDSNATSSSIKVYPLDLTIEEALDPPTKVIELLDVTTKTVDSVRYYNILGQASETPFEGINIVVTRYSDGSMTSRKVLR